MRILNHLGLLIAVVCAAIGSAGFKQLQVTVYRGVPLEIEPGFSIYLKDFNIEYYSDNTPKRFYSDISIHTKDNQVLDGTLEVNKPIKTDGWSIYQYGYDVQSGADSPYSTLLLVRDPWLPGVYIGFILMLAGAISLLFSLDFKIKGSKAILLASILLLLTAVFVYFFTPLFKAKTLIPALQSPWFAPHVIVYMLSYALLAAATVLALFHKESLTDNLVRAGVAFFTIGMLFGAFWAKQAWGHYWTWDPKETWAAITWICYLVYMHLRKAGLKNWRVACTILVSAFLCLQMCWWGINYLPSAGSRSVHTYNVKNN